MRYMKPEYFRQNEELIPLVLLVASAAFAVLIMVKTTSFFAASAKAEHVVKRAIEQNGSNAEDIEESVAKASAIADELKSESLFVPPAPKRGHPVTAVLGILGDEALIRGKWYKAGDNVRDAKIVAIEPTRVRIEWQGVEKVFSPIQTASQSGSAWPRSIGRGARAVAQAKGSPQKLAEMVQIGRQKRLGADPQLSDEQMAKFEQKAEKQRLAIEKKELQRFSRGDKKKVPTDPRKAAAQKKKTSSDIKKAKEKAAGKKTVKLSQK